MLTQRGDDDYRWFKMVTGTNWFVFYIFIYLLSYIHLVPIQGEESKWVGVCTDIHDQKLQEEQAIIDKTTSNFLAMMSHGNFTLL